MQATSNEEMQEAMLKLSNELKEKGNAEFKAKNLLEAKGFYREALQKLEDCSAENAKALKVDSEDVKSAKVNLFQNTAIVLNALGDYDSAVKACTAALQISPDAVKPVYQRGQAYLKMEDYEQAAADFKEAVQRQNDVVTKMASDDPKLKAETTNLKQIKKLYAGAVKNLLNPVEKKKVPVTILTGFLGSGKTTLLNRILKENHGKKIAVIENEFGAVGVDDKLVLEEKALDGKEAIIEVMNGCICCTVRQDLVETITEMKKKYIDSGKIDYIIIETTGMADPAPILQTFLLNDEIQEFCKIDSCLTICDGPSIVMRLEEDREEGCENEAVEQICFADKIFLNKIDVCTREQLDAATKKIREFNEKAPVEEVQFNNAELPLSKLLDLDMFSIERALEVDDGLMDDVEEEHKHDSRIGTFSYKMESEVTIDGANKFLGSVLQEKGANIYRMKGFLSIEGSDDKYVFHSVGMLFSCVPYVKWKPEEKRECLFVIIGKHLEQKWLEDMFKEAAVNRAEVRTIKNENLEKNLAALKNKD